MIEDEIYNNKHNSFLLSTRKVKTTLRLLLFHAETKLSALFSRRKRCHFFFVFDTKVGFQDLDALFVNIIVGMLLQIFNLGQAFRFRDEDSHLVLAVCGAGLVVSDLQNVLQSLQGDRDNLWVRSREQVAKRTDATLLDQELDLLLVSAARGVGDGPRGFLANVEFGVGEQLNERRNNVVINDVLNLLLVSGCVCVAVGCESRAL